MSDKNDKDKAAKPEASSLVIPTPRADASYDEIATMHQNLERQGKHAEAAAFHKEHVATFKDK